MIAALAGCGTASQVPRDYVWAGSDLNFVPEARPFVQPEPRPAGRAAPVARAAPPGPTVPRPRPAEPGERPQSTLPERISQEGATAAPPLAVPRAQPPAAPASAPPPQNTEDVRAAQRVEAAQALLGTSGLQDRAFVAHVLRAAGQDIAVDAKQPYAAALWARLDDSRVGKSSARSGDLVFFRDTADLNGNGKPDDGVTLVGVVEKAHGPHVLFIAHRAGKVRRMAVDPTRPLVIRDGAGEVINTRLVRWPGSPDPWTTGQCLTGYARPR
ncbi:MAG: hypothetical protein FJ100_19150 [Deltaproteobacteria bacterium]|nr:hypothetical protein [Deltaproteobacteria bacterium]